MQISKLCKTCTVEKPAEEYSQVHRQYKGKHYVYLQSECKECIRNRWRKYNPKELTEAVAINRAMQAPISWERMRHKPTPQEKHRVYPLCGEGHRYVGPTCLLCRSYSLLSYNRAV